MNNHIVLLDIETQQDFFLPQGSCYSARADHVRINIIRLFRWARESRLRVISSVLSNIPGEKSPIGEDLPSHCVEGSPGAEKLPGTLIYPCINLGIRNCTDLLPDLFDRYRQVIFEKRYSTDIIAHARPERLISEMPHTRFVLCGAGLSQGLVEAALGLRFYGFDVTCAMDGMLNIGGDRKYAMLKMRARGVEIMHTETIIKRYSAVENREFSHSASCLKAGSVLPLLQYAG